KEYEPSANLTMAAVGMDGLLLDGGAEGLSLTTTDLLTVTTTTAAVEGLESSEGSVTRYHRLGLEATRLFPLSNGASLLPSLEVGIRQDSGDTESGFGMEMGAGLRWDDPERGVSAELKGRSLLSHAEEEFREQGLAVSLAWDPTPGNRGPSLSLSHSLGAVGAGGMDALLHPVVLEGLDAAAGNGQQQFAAEWAYLRPPHLGRAPHPDAGAGSGPLPRRQDLQSVVGSGSPCRSSPAAPDCTVGDLPGGGAGREQHHRLISGALPGAPLLYPLLTPLPQTGGRHGPFPWPPYPNSGGLHPVAQTPGRFQG
ncbi:MAG: hypothetical protein OXG70_05675, partial [Cyanobacteria bacterium MAG IRC1_bin_28]|nr:hypothetical protein [Cyanobacteria bacterium MAG IRC1_bin_28]